MRIAHAKAMVIDGKVTLAGSMNWSRDAALNSEDLNLVVSAQVAETYATHWRQRRSASVPFTGRDQGAGATLREAAREDPQSSCLAHARLARLSDLGRTTARCGRHLWARTGGGGRPQAQPPRAMGLTPMPARPAPISFSSGIERRQGFGDRMLWIQFQDGSGWCRRDIGLC